MIIGIRRRQWLLLFLTTSIPILLNGVAIWNDIGSKGILQILTGTYSPYPYKSFGIIYNPLPEIFLSLLLITIPLDFLAWLIIFILNKPFFQKQPIVLRVIEIGLTASLVAGVFVIATSFFMPLTWLPKFHDYKLGLPASPLLIKWSGRLIFPITIITLFSAVLLSRQDVDS